MPSKVDGKYSPRPVKAKRIFEVILDQIRAEIDAGRLAPGDKLPAERDLAASLGVSRLAVREAIRILEYAGVVGLQKGVNGGAFILNGRSESVMQSIQDLVYLGGITLDSLTEARIVILEPVVRLACINATDKDFDAIDSNIDFTESSTSSGDADERLRVAGEFYSIIGRATGNGLLEILINSITTVVLRRVVKAHPEMFRGMVKRRREFAAFFRNRDADAATKSLTDHLRSVHETLATQEMRTTQDEKSA